MALPLIMAGISAATSIAGGIINSREANSAAQKQQAMIDKQKADNANWYNRRYFEDGTQRADVQRVLTNARETLIRSNKAASGTNAVMGGTNATAAAAKEASNMAYADAVSQAAAQADERKDGIEQTYLQNKATNEAQQMQFDAARSEAKQKAVSDAVQSVGNVATSVIGSVDSPAQNTETTTSASGTIGPVGNNSTPVLQGKNELNNKLKANVNSLKKGAYNGSSTEAWVARQNGKINKLV